MSWNQTAGSRSVYGFCQESHGKFVCDFPFTNPQLIAAANAAGLDPASAPLVKQGPRGVAAFLPCHSGFVALHAVPDEGLCFVDVAGLGPVHPQRGLDIVAKRLGARVVRTDARRRGAVTQPIEPERL